ncbi:hypothetical protein [Thiosulfativibrio zosterae]|uniref:Ribbon-helix-helix protein CopG domain-containing protein n=1 Tax=Thiosulfativibrio zosterae TaxID=2675053 RepID=A0A6F8PMM4_9GAMM|nr:hypothetical protein [Thiosulfativibrio zosterae]BBP43361.1 hypothetical protein THMIRHAT_11070 [Thiosulfativibrio zosterae]
MGSLTIRLDDEADALLEHFSKVLNQNKSHLARTGIMNYLQQQQVLEEQKAALKNAITLESHAEVASRVRESELSYVLSDEEYEQEMDAFFAKELGLIR